MTYSTKYGDLLARQAELQRLGNMPEPTQKQLKAALLDEIGELNHELKPLWAWWKKEGDRGEVDRERVLSEAADVLHFLLLANVQADGLATNLGDCELLEIGDVACIPPYVMLNIIEQSRPYYSACLLCDLVAHFGYTPADLARAYWEKT